jgi:hypothetical protein
MKVKIVSLAVNSDDRPLEVFQGYTLVGYDDDYLYCCSTVGGTFEVLKTPYLSKFDRKVYKAIEDKGI